MKKINILLVLILLFISGCGRGKPSHDERSIFVTVDVRKNYPKKEFSLQNMMSVEYVALETTDEFICQGRILDIGENYILARNNGQDGNLFLFDRKGKGVKKINYRGQGNEEYIILYGAILDEENNEIFINDIIGRKIVVYNLDGAFKRNIKTDEGIRYENIYSFDREHLIGDVGDNGKATEKTFRIITKENGSLAKEIKIPFEQKKSTITTDANGKLQSLYYYAPLLPYHDSWILTEASSDTIFCLRPDFSVNPFIVNTPSVQSSVFANLFLFSKIQTDRYYFMEKVSNKEKIIKTDLLYDTKEKAIYEYTLFNDDYSNKQQVTMANSECSNAKIVFWQKMEAHSLVESFQKGELKGKLKTIAANLDNESNPVIMLVKIK